MTENSLNMSRLKRFQPLLLEKGSLGRVIPLNQPWGKRKAIRAGLNEMDMFLLISLFFAEIIHISKENIHKFGKDITILNSSESLTKR